MTTRAMRTYRSLLPACLFLSVVAAVVGYGLAQPSPKPLTKDEVVKLLGGVPAKRVEALVREYGIDFQITPETESELRKAGAPDPLLAALRDVAPKPPTLEVTTTPVGAQVFVDNELIARTGQEGHLKISALTAGLHKLRVSLDGYGDYENAVDLKAGMALEIHATLEPIRQNRPFAKTSAVPVSKRLATGSSDGTAKVWDAETGKELLTLTGHTGPISSVSWNSDGERLATVVGMAGRWCGTQRRARKY